MWMNDNETNKMRYYTLCTKSKVKRPWHDIML